jgi:hypothetical protein
MIRPAPQLTRSTDQPIERIGEKGELAARLKEL